MTTRICVLLLLSFFATSQQISPIQMPAPKVSSSDSEFTNNVAGIMSIMKQLVLVNDINSVTTVKIGTMEHFNGTGYWKPQAFGDDISIEQRKKTGKEIEKMIHYWSDQLDKQGKDFVDHKLNKFKRRTIIKRNVALFDFGDQMLVFLANDIAEPKKK